MMSVFWLELLVLSKFELNVDELSDEMDMDDMDEDMLVLKSDSEPNLDSLLENNTPGLLT